MLDTVVGWITTGLKYALSLLPDSPFTMISNSPVAVYLGYVNWFMPVSFFISTTETWLTAVAFYYAISALLRWAKAIS